jgi:hypothetical protein
MGDSPARFLDLCLDAVDHQAIADWWCAAMGYVRHREADRTSTGPVLLVDPTGAGPELWVNRVAEATTVENRMHLDVTGDTDALLALGATRIRRRDDVDAGDHETGLISWDVLADPEGNEFCVHAPA